MLDSDSLAKEIESRQVGVAVVGLGYVGLPLALAFCEAGFKVTGIDTDDAKTTTLGAGRSYIQYIPGERIDAAVGEGLLAATTDFERARECRIILICVPTPLDAHRQPDLSYLEATARSLAPHMAQRSLICLESTTYPGTTEDLLIPLLQAGSGLTAGEDFLVCFSPEREDPNNPSFSIRNTPKVVGGHTPEAAKVAQTLYGMIVDRVVAVSNPKTAEATKLMENIFRSVNIALVNEMKMIFDAMGIDVWEVIEAARTKPFGFMPFYPGPGLGGHCIPIDPFYLAWKAKEYEIPVRFIELAGEINTNMPHYVARKVMQALDDRGKTTRGASILIVGLAYKKDVDDIRETPSLKLMELLESRGARVDYHDPHRAVIPKTRRYPGFVDRRSVPLARVGDYDAVVVATDHSCIDFKRLAADASLVIDTRHACPDGRNVVRA
jgi:UDP-N-acetyl-D-glucosamine dehydrogenase